MNLTLKTISILFVFTLIQCKNAEQNKGDGGDGVKAIAVQKLGDGVEYSPNGDGSLMLCYKKQKDESGAGYGVSFFVFDMKEKEVVYEEEIGKGTVSWHSDGELALFYTPGIMRNDQTRDDFTYIYNLSSEERTLKSEM